MNEEQKRQVDQASGLESGRERKSSALNPFSEDDVWLFDMTTGEFVIGNKGDPGRKPKQFRNLTPEERAAMETKKQTPVTGVQAPPVVSPGGLQGQAPLRGATTVGQAPVTGVNTNQFVGVPGNVPQFTTVQEAEAAGLPKGTVIMIAGRKARVE
jgi:hypothetical protein